MDFRIEHDSMGEVRVPADRLYGAQTERSRQNFRIGVGLETMPAEIIHAFGILKAAAARANYELQPKKMTAEKLAVIETAAKKVMDGELMEEFPLVVWQTGSGTQSNMNANEVIANLANRLTLEKQTHRENTEPATDGQPKESSVHSETAEPSTDGQSEESIVHSETAELSTDGQPEESSVHSETAEPSTDGQPNVHSAAAKPAADTQPEVKLCHPNDDVNMSQSSNDTFPTAMHIAAVLSIEKLIPAISRLAETFVRLEEANAGLVKCGRTHLQDAVPITFAQEISGWRFSLERDMELLKNVLAPLRELALGGTAVGTGLNAPEGFDELAAKEISALTGTEFRTSPNKFHALTSKDELVFAHGAMKALAADLMKIANDVRWLASGPRLGLGEITIPANEPGSSIMPGKVNPTQCEQVTMVAVQVMANDVAVGLAASQGNFELNVFMPVMAYNFLQSARLLRESIESFRVNCAEGITANREKMKENLERSLMLVTALNPVIGYEKAAKTAQKAFAENSTLKEACVALGYLTPDRFDEVFHPEKMA